LFRKKGIRKHIAKSEEEKQSEAAENWELGHGGSRGAGMRGGLMEQSEITGEIFKLKPPE
jgi:hypothetical protein